MTKFKCPDCGQKCEPVDPTDARAIPRCTLCAAQHDQRTRYDNPIRRAQSVNLVKRAQKKPKQAKHCPQCHYPRPNDSYTSVNDHTALCELCRADNENTLLDAERKARAYQRMLLRVKRNLSHD